ncbi:MAG: Ig-like domain-containing protein [Rikenellaceae bacterium]
MKLKSFFALIVSASMLFAACSESDDAVDPDDSSTTTSTATSISVDQSTLSMEVGDYTTLVATLDPSDATGTITWASSDATVAAVGSESGTVVAVSAGTASIVASCGSLTATCTVTVLDAGLHESLQGSDYYLVALDYITYDVIADRLVADLRVDDSNVCLYIWDDTYTAGTCSGVNAYGETESWTSLSVTSVGWSGLGVCAGVTGDYTGIDMLSAITDSPDEYYLHIALKSTVAASHAIKMEAIGSGIVVIGNNGAIDGYSVNYELTSDGEWHHYDIPMTDFTSQGFSFYSQNAISQNVFIILSGGTAGTPLDYDAVFFYKK